MRRDDQAMTAPPTLTLIVGEGSDAQCGLRPNHSESLDDAPVKRVERSLRHRPGDQIELWAVPDGAVLEPIRRAARARGLSGDTAVALVVERRLALTELGDVAPADLETALDARSEEAHASIELWSAHGSYLRHLLHGEDLQRDSEQPLSSPRVGLPIRLLDRANAASPLTVAPCEVELEQAIVWEIAALVCGETIAEWAYRCALEELCAAASSL